MLGATVFRSAGISISGGIPEVEGSDLGCQDELTRLTLSSSHPEGTSSPEERGHSDADATKPQLDARHPVLVGSELGERRLRPLPMTCPTAETLPPSRRRRRPSWVWAEVFSAGFMQERGSVLSFSKEAI